jgi:cephalosporin hydroxylase
MELPKDFDEEKKRNIDKQGMDKDLADLALDFMRETGKYKYTYNFTWMGRPIIQFPQDMIAVQEIIWSIRPDLIIETGVAHGGGLIFYASMLELLGNNGHVVGVEIELRHHNRVAIDNHPMRKRISMIEGSSIDPAVVARVRDLVKPGRTAMVLLDSNHTHEHVLRELELYSAFVNAGSYLVVFDTVIEDQPEGYWPDRPWGKTNNPKTAVWEFLKKCDRFVIDKEIENKLLITVSRDGYLKCVKDFK